MSSAEEVIVFPFRPVLKETIAEAECQEDGKENPDPIEDAYVGPFSEPGVLKVIQERIGGSRRAIVPADSRIGHGHDHPEIEDGIGKREEDVKDPYLVDGVGEDEVDHREEGDDDVEADGGIGVQKRDSAHGNQDEVEQASRHRDGDDGEESNHEGQPSAIPMLSEIAVDVRHEEDECRNQDEEVRKDGEVGEDEGGSLFDGLDDGDDESGQGEEEDDRLEDGGENEDVPGVGIVMKRLNHFPFPPFFHR